MNEVAPYTSGDAEVVSVVYDGGLAASGLLQFYDYGRATYAFARLVATIEHFRRTGKVAQRINSKNYVNIIIKAPEKGSFPLDILIPIFEELVKEAPKFAHVPVGIFLKYIMHSVTRLLPKEEKKILELASIELEREKQRTLQSAEETKRFEVLERMVESGNVNNRLSIEMLRQAQTLSDARAAELIGGSKEIKRILEKLEEYELREKEFTPYKSQLESIGHNKLAKLTRKVRPQINEIGLPLRSSAEVVQFSLGKDREKFATYNKDSIKDINSRLLDSSSSAAELRIFAYDRDSGIGKCDVLDEEIYRISCGAPIELRSELRPKILKAIDRDAVRAEVRYFRNLDISATKMDR